MFFTIVSLQSRAWDNSLAWRRKFHYKHSFIINMPVFCNSYIFYQIICLRFLIKQVKIWFLPLPARFTINNVSTRWKQIRMTLSQISLNCICFWIVSQFLQNMNKWSFIIYNFHQVLISKVNKFNVTIYRLCSANRNSFRTEWKMTAMIEKFLKNNFVNLLCVFLKCKILEKDGWNQQKRLLYCFFIHFFSFSTYSGGWIECY